MQQPVEKFTPTFLEVKKDPANELAALQDKYRGMSDLLERVATFPSKVSYPHVLVPQSKVALRYMKIVHTNEFKLLPESELCASPAEQQQALQRADFVSYTEAGQLLKDRQRALVKRILEFQKKHNLPLSKLEDRKSVGNKEKHSQPSVTASAVSEKAAAEEQSNSAESSLSASIVPSKPAVSPKKAVPKPQVFEIREFIGEDGQAVKNEVVDITQQLEMMEKLAAEQTETSGGGFTEEDDFVRELAKLRGEAEKSPQREVGDLDDIFARLQEKPRPQRADPPVVVAAPAAPAVAASTSGAGNKAGSGGWKAGFLSGNSSNKKSTDSTASSSRSSPSEAVPAAKKSVQFSASNEVRTIIADSTVSKDARKEHSPQPAVVVAENENSLLKDDSAMRPYVEKPKAAFQTGIVEKTPSQAKPKPFGFSVMEKQPAAPKPMIIGSTRRNL